MEAFTSFFMVLYLARVRQEGEGELWWVPSKNGLFDVKSFYSVMGCHDGVHFSWKIVWHNNVLLRVAFFGWSADLGKNQKILAMDSLCKRHDIVVDWCCLCKRNEESMNHLLLYCEVACAIWKVFFSRFGLS
jgi:hypothetical protein